MSSSIIKAILFTWIYGKNLFKFGIMCCMLSMLHVSSRIVAIITVSSCPSQFFFMSCIAGEKYYQKITLNILDLFFKILFFPIDFPYIVRYLIMSLYFLLSGLLLQLNGCPPSCCLFHFSKVNGDLKILCYLCEGRLSFQCIDYYYTAYMALDVWKKADKLNHSLTSLSYLHLDQSLDSSGLKQVFQTICNYSTLAYISSRFTPTEFRMNNCTITVFNSLRCGRFEWN